MSDPILTVFRNRLRADGAEAYGELAPQILELARSMAGFVDAKTFTAADGERVTVVTFADQASHNAWRDHPEHRAAQQRGIAEFYSDYSIQVATVTYDHRFHHDGHHHEE
jgi:heme-degrading monooxygenase HmoA